MRPRVKQKTNQIGLEVINFESHKYKEHIYFSSQSNHVIRTTQKKSKNSFILGISILILRVLLAGSSLHTVTVRVILRIVYHLYEWDKSTIPGNKI